MKRYIFETDGHRLVTSDVYRDPPSILALSPHLRTRATRARARNVPQTRQSAHSAGKWISRPATCG